MGEGARKALTDSAALWSVDQCRSEEIVKLACDALVAGLDSEPLRELAAVPYPQATAEVPDLLEPALTSLGLPFYPPWGSEGKLAAVKVYAARCLSGEMAPRAFVGWMHIVFQHGESDELEPFLSLSDYYEEAVYRNITEEQIDVQVIVAARKLLGHQS